jgi:uncharacterized glyoxalase superfamily protein PhnB
MAIHQLFPYLHVKDASRAIDFYVQAFGAVEKLRLTEPGGRIGHAELDFAGSTVMLADEYPECGIRGPASVGETTVSLHLHVDSADDAIRQAVAAGGTLEREAKDEFYGERSGVVRDPFGHRWNIGSHIEDVSPEEMQRRYTELLRKA